MLRSFARFPNATAALPSTRSAAFLSRALGARHLSQAAAAKRCIAVFDVGKTNKKVMVFDADTMERIDASYRSFPETEKDGLKFEDMSMGDWMLKEMKRHAAKHPIRAIAVTTHGATYTCLDSQGQLAVPVVSYTNEVADDAFSQEFAHKFGQPDALQVETATADFRPFLINIAKGIYFTQKTFPQQFARTKTILSFANYFAYRLSGVKATDSTFILGCHTLLWNQLQHTWSSVAHKLGITSMLPKVLPTPAALGPITPAIAAQTGLRADTVVMNGVHDSNASLVPYLLTQPASKPFVVLSGGTWTVLMRPAKKAQFAPADLGKAIFYNIDVRAQPVRTVIFLGGLQFQKWMDVIAITTGGKRLPKGAQPQLDLARYKRILKQKRQFVIPAPNYLLSPRAGVFADGQFVPMEDLLQNKNVPAFMRDLDEAVATLELSTACQMSEALAAVGLAHGMNLFVEGNIKEDGAQMPLLATLFPQSRVMVTDIREATAYGAALMAKAQLDGRKPQLDEQDSAAMAKSISLNEVAINGVPELAPLLASYKAAFLSNVDKSTKI